MSVSEVQLIFCTYPRSTTACVPACYVPAIHAVAVTVSQGQQHCAHMLYSPPIRDRVVGPETFQAHNSTISLVVIWERAMGILLPDLSYSLPYMHNVEKNNNTIFITSVGLTHTRLTYVILGSGA